MDLIGFYPNQLKKVSSNMDQWDMELEFHTNHGIGRSHQILTVGQY